MYRFVNHPSMICDIKAHELFNVVISKTFKLHVCLILCTERNLKFNFHFIQKEIFVVVWKKKTKKKQNKKKQKKKQTNKKKKNVKDIIGFLSFN